MLKAVRLNRYQDVYLRDIGRMYLQRTLEEVAELNNKEKENALNEVRILASIKNKYVVG